MKSRARAPAHASRGAGESAGLPVRSMMSPVCVLAKLVHDFYRGRLVPTSDQAGTGFSEACSKN